MLQFEELKLELSSYEDKLKDLAEALGKNEAEISRWMRGTHNFTIRTLAKISNVLGTPIVGVLQ